MSVFASSPRTADPRDAAHVCGTCRSTLVQCVGRERLTQSHWAMTLECPECCWSGTGDFTADDVEAFDERAERAAAAMHAEAGRLATSYADSVVAEFAAALADDLIRPESF